MKAKTKPSPLSAAMRIACAAALPMALGACAADESSHPAPESGAATEELGAEEVALAEPPAQPAGETTDTADTTAAATDPMPEPTEEEPVPTPGELAAEEVATLAAGCFWCIEAVLEQVDGVDTVVSGYMGGETKNPTYKDICTGRTGHAEVVRVTFDPSVISYAELLDWFWRLHDPTTLNRQGNDVGTQYRSAIFTHTPEQRRIAQTSKKDVQPSFDDPIVTEITDASTFYVAEGYHQGYYFDNTRQGYCRAVIAPKLKKLGLKY